jgi:hypothetical protein
VTHYQQLAIQLTAALDAFRAAIPNLESVTPGAKAFIKRKKRIPQPFVTAAVGSLALSPDLQGVKQFSPEESTDDTQFIEAITPLSMNVVMLGRELVLTVQAREARMATRAQKVYAVARGLALDRDPDALLPHLDNMKRALRTGKPRPRRPHPEATTSRCRCRRRRPSRRSRKEVPPPRPSRVVKACTAATTRPCTTTPKPNPLKERNQCHA